MVPSRYDYQDRGRATSARTAAGERFMAIAMMYVPEGYES
jgi:hypothetical protein